ncbi:MAG: hypothetical protein Kow0025_04250 [Thermodesulfovibrionales bacterium]
MDVPIPGGIAGLLRPDIQGRSDPEAIKAVAREVESLFAYELVKVMREGTTTEGGLGGDTYLSLFDMELARVLADRGLGLQETIIRGLSRLGGEKEENPEGVDGDSAGQADLRLPGRPGAGG